MIKTYEMRRPRQIGDSLREIGEPAPEAHLWRLTTGLITGGVLVETEMSEKDFAAAVAKYCPENAEEIYGQLGIEVFESTGTEGTADLGGVATELEAADDPEPAAPKRRTAKKVLTKPPEALEK